MKRIFSFFLIAVFMTLPVAYGSGYSVSDDAPLSGSVNLWEKGNIPTVTRNANNSDGRDFIPNLEIFTVHAGVTLKGAVMICPGGAFMFRSMRNEGYDIADMLTAMGYQSRILFRVADRWRFPALYMDLCGSLQ